MKPDELFRRYQDLQAYVGWTDDDARRVRALAPLIEPHFRDLIDDFYAEIEKHPDARRVITGGAAQVERLKGTLTGWLRELVSGRYDADYVVRRWRVGYRHVEIGLDQVYTNVALSRLRTGLCRAVLDALQAPADESLSGKGDRHPASSSHSEPGPPRTGASSLFRTDSEVAEAVRSLNKLLDLDLAIIEDAYQTEHTLRRQRAERLAAIGQVAGGIAHELRNPLNVIRTSVYYLLNARNPSPEKKVEHLRRIESQVGLADGVITALSNFAKLPLPSREEFAVGECVRRAVESCTLPGDIDVKLDCPETLPPALGDAGQVLIVLSNLIRNARDAMPQGGRLTIRARPAEDRIEITVADTGQGIAPENLKRILEPFYSTRARGIGLGLAISRAILDKNDGSLSVESEPGKGTAFTVRLPAAGGMRDEG